MVNGTSIGAVIFIFVLFTVIFVSVWISSIRNLEEVPENPYKPSIICPDGENINTYDVNGGKETINFCGNNAPNRSFGNSLKLCAAGETQYPGVDNYSDKLTNELIASYADFYVNEYLDTCGVSWRYDDFPASLYGCAQARGITSTSIERIGELATTS